MRPAGIPGGLFPIIARSSVPKNRSLPVLVTGRTANAPYRNKIGEIDMLKKTIASVGLAAAATAGALFLGGSPASAQTTQASAQSDVAYVQTIATSKKSHYADHHGHKATHHWHYYYGWKHNKHHADHHHAGHHADHNTGYHGRIVIHNSNTNVAVSG